MKDNPREKYESLRQVGMLTTIPFLLLASPLIGFGMGRLLDGWLHTKFLTWVFLGLGAVAGVREVVRLLKKASSSSDSDSNP